MVTFSKIRLNGFKSFVDAMELSIEPGLTGIVGPNGCGKSNLVEALRWAMGETSAKRIRGKEMEDVIFAGSGHRPARNVAEVVLELDNSRREAPAGFNDQDKLEIVRRIERGNGSLYRVNSQDVRAKDVQLLFADAATGAHSTALVSQGRIGAIINAKPTDRRALLEEAAGITGLHSRRHEAELRLKAAETNLERLDDVISTLESQLQGLKKQARQATRYRNLADHIRRHEAILLYMDGQRSEAELAKAEETLRACETKVGELTGQTAACSSEQAEAANALPPLRQSEAAAAAALQRLLVDRENLDREEARLAEAQERVGRHIAEIDSDRAIAERQAQDARQALNALDQEEVRLKEVADQAVALRESADEDLQAAEDAATRQEDRLSQRSERLAADEARSGALERRVRELTQRLERLRPQALKVSEDIQELEQRLADDSLLKESGAALEAAEATLGEARGESEASGEAAQSARDIESKAREALTLATKAHDKLQTEIAALARMLEVDQADIWPPIVDALTVEAGLEKALGAALGDDLQASADEAAPVHWESLPAYDASQPLPAGAKPLSAMVRGPNSLSRRLSQIGLVEDVAEGKRLQTALKPGQRLVTAAGDLWRWDGYTARAEAPSAAATRLAQRNRLAELQEQLPPLKRDQDEATALHGKASERLEAALARDKAARSALDQAFAEVSRCRDRHGEAQQQAAARSTRLTGLKESRERLSGEIGEAEAALAQSTAERAALPDLAAGRAEVTELRAELAERRGTLTQCRSAVDRLEREGDARNLRLSAIEQERQSWGERATIAEQQREQLTQRRGEAEEQHQALAEAPAELATKREALADQIEAAENRRKAAADRLAEGETRLAEADKALKAAEQAMATAREDRIRAEATLEQCRQTAVTLVERIRERLECTPEEVLGLTQLDPSQPLPDYEQVDTKLARLLRERDNMGPVNLRAEQEAQELDEQIKGLETEREDLVAAIARLRQGISSLNREGRQRLLAAFEEVNEHFSELFTRLFGGGKAHLALTEAEDPLEAGLEVMASPPGKRAQVLSLLSGGEQALTALALLFAVFLTNPAPICVLDEVDAPLDDANVDRFCALVEELAKRSQTRFLIITHHRMTMARMDRLYGVTMAEQGVSQLVSVDLEAASQLRETA